MEKKRKKFLKVPEYPGGKSNFQKYVADNLVYPEEAQKKHVEGIVYLSAEVDDEGRVSDARIEKGIGYGCDEEAIRLISDIHFGGVKNSGVRVKTRKKFRIQFRIKEKPVKFSYQYSYKERSDAAGKKTEDSTGKIHYSYTVYIKDQPRP